MNKRFNTKFLVRQGIIAALYAILTVIPPLSGLSYGPLQFRISEILTLLAFFNGDYIWGLTIGCFIANIFSPFAVLDVVVGTFASFLAATAMSKMKNIFVASTMPAVFSILIGLQLFLINATRETFFITTIYIMLSELIIVSFIGIPLFYILGKNKSLVNTLDLNKRGYISHFKLEVTGK